MKVTFTKKNLEEHPVKDGIRIDYAPQKRVFPWIRWYLILLLVMSPLLYFAYSMLTRWLVIESPAVIAVERAVVSMPRNGRIEALSADIAAGVRAGDPLMWVVPQDWENERRNLELLRARLRNYGRLRPAQTLVPGVSVSQESLEIARQSHAYWRENRENYEALRDAGAATEAEYREALERENSARSALAQLQAQAQPDRYLPVPEDPAFALDRMQLEEEIAALEKDLQGEVVLAPVPGKIADVHGNAGQTLTLGTPVIEIVNDERLKIRAFVNERAMPYIYDKPTVSVTLPGGEKVEAELASTPIQTSSLPANMSTALAAGRMLLVELQFTAPLDDKYLVDGLPATVHWGFWKPGMKAWSFEGSDKS